MDYCQSAKGFKHSDIIRSGFDIFFCDDVAEDIREHLRETLESIPENKVSSVDTLLRYQVASIPFKQFLKSVIIVLL